MRFKALFLMLTVLGFAWSGDALAREASFLQPGAGAENFSDAIVVQPKDVVDAGETPVGISRRVTIFFANQTNESVDVVGVTADGDGNVRSEVISDDCSKQGQILPSGRCSVVVEVTPSGSGTWASEVLLTHKGAGRITRAKITGKTSGKGANEKAEEGLALQAKENKPVNFGDVEVDSGKAVRSALMINDSPETITLLSIDVIAAEDDLERLEQGCMVDMQLKPGESCPVTMIWQPVRKGQISTDLIIRHSGRLGFAVIPVRGNASVDPKKEKENDEARANAKKNLDSSSQNGEQNNGVNGNSSEQFASSLPALPSSSLSSADMSLSSSKGSKKDSGQLRFYLIGTVGSRAVLLTPDQKTIFVGVGDEFSYGDTYAEMVSVFPKSAEFLVDGETIVLSLQAADSLKDRAGRARDRKEQKSDSEKEGAGKEKAKGQ